MRLIPVMDLKGGLAVHAVRGERQRYQPVKSVLSQTAQPLAIASAFRDQLGLSELYIADLDAIQGAGDHRSLIAALASQTGMQLLVDAGFADSQSAAEGLVNGATKVIVGSETLPDWETLDEILAILPSQRLIFSLDMRAGRILSLCGSLAEMHPIEALGHLRRWGWQEVILLDLARVGSAAGAGQELVREARQSFPELSLLVGGGVRDLAELEELQALGVDGVLLATALHTGALTRQQIDRLVVSRI